jgi:hypothetical protein
MREGLSIKIVSFIGSLHPLYEQVYEGGRLVGARSLTDGTLIQPIDEDEDNENGFVLVLWQGDKQRACETRGEWLATIAVARYEELHAVAADKRTSEGYAIRANHFTFKTGGSLGLEIGDSGAEAYALLGQLLRKSGTAVAIGLLKKAIGL